VKPRDPFDNLYATIANDLLVARQALTREQRVQVHQVATLRFASDLAPYAFKPYLAQDAKRGTYAVVRLPAADDPVVQRMDRVRERDYSLIDTLNEHYTAFGETIDEAYINWRKYAYEELEAEAEAKRKAMTRGVLGAAAVIGGVLAAQESNTSAGSAASTAAVLGTLELKGSAEQQYAEWRRLLRELYENETGLPAVTAETAKPPTGKR
jgi:hypothetical protein